MLIKMLKRTPLPDGKGVFWAEIGDEIEVEDDVGDSLIRGDDAEEVSSEKPSDVKAFFAAPSNK